MTKPTGRSRGRPKTKEYVTLIARVDITLAEQVKRYASLHRQPISVVIRDALTLLMEEYPFLGDRSGPHRLAAHEFLSDRYDSSLDMLLGETDSAELEALLSDTNEGVIDTILEGANRRSEVVSDTTLGDTPRRSDRTAAHTESTPVPAMMSDTKEGMPDIVSDDNENAAMPTRTPARRLSRKMSDKKAAQKVP